MYKNFFKTLQHCTNTQGTRLMNAMNELRLDYHTTGEPTYWHLYLLDFIVSKANTWSDKLSHHTETLANFNSQNN